MKQDKKYNQEQLKVINGRGNIYKTVQRRYSQGHHQNQATIVELNKELLTKRKNKHSAHYMKQKVIQQNMCIIVEEIQIENRKSSKIIQKKNGRKQCRYIGKTKEKDEKEEKRFRKKTQLGFGRPVQPWTVDVLVLNWSAQSQDLRWGVTFLSDQRE